MKIIKFSRKLFSKSSKRLQFLIFIIILIYVGAFRPVNALDWDDKFWKRLGCPGSISGTWVSRDGNKSFRFEDHQITAITKDGEEKVYSHNDSLQASGKRLINIVLKPKNFYEEKLRFLKVRPHLAFSENTSSPPICYIKIFRFNSKKAAKFNKYTGWNIFKRM